MATAVGTILGLLAAGCGGGAEVTLPPPAQPPAQPVITLFQASVTAVDRDDSVTLSATFTGAAGVLNPGALIMTSGVPLVVQPDGTTTYVLRVANAQGSVSSNVTVEEYDAVVSTDVDAGAGSLREALVAVQFAGGGTIGIATNDPIDLQSSLPKVFTDVTLQSAGGFAASINGQDAHRILFVDAGAHLHLASLTLEHGRARGGDGFFGSNVFLGGGGGGGGGGMGGAIFANSGVVTCDLVDFEQNTAGGGSGGTFSGSSAGAGGGFAGNAGFLVGGDGGPLGGAGGGPGQPGGIDGGGGGPADPSNPIPGAGAFGGAGGSGVGGAGGFGGGNGGNTSAFNGAGGGGGGLGGAIFVRDGYLGLSSCTFSANAASGGAAGTGFSTGVAAGGLGLGGAIFLAPTTFAFQTGIVFSGNAASSDGGVPGNDDDMFGTLD